MPPGRHIVLLVSLVFNVLAVGVVGGAGWVGYNLALHRAHRGRPILAAGEGLPPDDLRRFRQTLRAVLAEGRPLRQQAEQSRQAAAAAFVQPRFDAQAVTADLLSARQADVELRTRLEGAVVEFARTLSPSERAVLARGLVRGGPLRHAGPSHPQN